MQNNQCGDKLAAALKGKQIDILINNAGYFYEPVEKIDSLNFEEVMRGAILSFHLFFCTLIWVTVLMLYFTGAEDDRHLRAWAATCLLWTV